MKLKFLIIIILSLALVLLISCRNSSAPPILETQADPAKQAMPESVTQEIAEPAIQDPIEQVMPDAAEKETSEVTEQAPLEHSEFVEESDSGSGNGIVKTGVIIGEVFYKDIAVSRLFLEPFSAVLGDPIRERGHHMFFEDLEIVASWDDASESYVFAEQMHIFNNLNLYNADGITFDKNRIELINSLGNPIEYYEYPGYVFRASDDDRMVRYHVSSCTMEYVLDFWFDNPDSQAYSLAIRQMGH